jgi:hypothetical protein
VMSQVPGNLPAQPTNQASGIYGGFQLLDRAQPVPGPRGHVPHDWQAHLNP